MSDYKDRVISLDRALAFVQSGDRLFSGSSANDARLFFGNIHKIAGRVKDVAICNLNCPYDHEYLDPRYKDSFNIESLFYSAPMRKAHANGNLSFVPGHVSMFHKRVDRAPPDIFVCAASAPDRHGFVSLSLSTLYDLVAFRRAKTVILEINPNFPRTFGDVTTHISKAHYLIEADYAPPEIPEAPLSDKDRIIGRFVSDLIPDRACIQVGIGGIPDAVANALLDKKGLGVHSEMITTGIMRLIQSGAVTNEHKNINRHKTVCSFAFGTKEFYRFIDDNPSIEFLDGAYTNNPHIVARNDLMMSINTTLEVDLTGQCCSETVGARQLSGTGGQAEMAEGAQMSKGGKAFICLHSTAQITDPATGEKIETSRIAPVMRTGAVVTLPRANADYVVTEYGVADLRGATVKERVEALVAIAHPAFRDGLLNEAEKLQYI